MTSAKIHLGSVGGDSEHSVCYKITPPPKKKQTTVQHYINRVEKIYLDAGCQYKRYIKKLELLVPTT